MKRRNLFLFTALALVLCVILSACGADAGMDEMAPSEKGDYDYDYGMAKDDYYSEATNSSLEKPNGEEADATDYAEKIIRDVTMSAETRDFDRALAEIRNAASECGGYEQSVSTSGRSYSSGATYTRSARLVLRIPSGELDGFLGEVGELVNVVSQSANATNVTTQYYDIQSRINVLESEKAAYEEMLKKSDDVNYLLEIKDRLYNVIEEIESYETQLRLYDNKVAYSTVTMSLEEVVEYSEIPTTKDTFGTRVIKAFTESWQNFVSGFQGFVVILIYALPTLLVLGAIAGVIVGICVGSYRRKLKKEQKRDK